jgi:hypothetical protein
MQKNLNSASGRPDKEIRAENMAKYKEQIEKEFAEKEDYERRQAKYNSHKYIRLPIVVEAYKWFTNMGGTPGLIAAPNGWHIDTDNGLVSVKDGDYIIRDISGKYYSCNSEIFDETHEVID